jgi:uncharacterized protein YggU (UPF0235/DUF167 family)
MKIFVRVKPGSSLEKIEREGDEYIVWLREKAIEGKANEALRRVLAREFGVPRKDVVVKTPTGRRKVVEILC